MRISIIILLLYVAFAFCEFDYVKLFNNFPNFSSRRHILIDEYQENFVKDIKSNQDINKFVGNHLLMATSCLARDQSNLVKLFLSEQERTVTISKKNSAKKVMEGISCYNILEFIFENIPSNHILDLSLTSDERGWNPLHIAVEFGFKDAASLLLSKGINPSLSIPPLLQVEAEGNEKSIPYYALMTPIHLSTVNGDEDIIELLIHHKADVDSKDFFGRTALDIARTLYSPSHSIVKLLENSSKNQRHINNEHQDPPPSLNDVPLFKMNSKNLNKNFHEENGGWNSKLDFILAKEYAPIKCDLPSIQVDELTVEYFLKEHVTIKRPLKVVQGAASWKAMDSWTRYNFKEKYGNVKVDTGEIPYGEIFGMDHKLEKMGDFIRYMDKKEESEIELDKSVPQYIFDYEVLSSKSKSSMKQDYEFHPVFHRVWKSFEQFPQFLLGGPKTGAPFHYHCHAVNGIAYGSKMWFLLPPSESFYSKEPIWEWVQRIDKKELQKYGSQCIQEASDLVYVPSFWTHSVLNLKTSIGVAVETDGVYC